MQKSMSRPVALSDSGCNVNSDSHQFPSPREWKIDSKRSAAVLSPNGCHDRNHRAALPLTATVTAAEVEAELQLVAGRPAPVVEGPHTFFTKRHYHPTSTNSVRGRV